MKRPLKFAAILAAAVCFAFAFPKAEDAKVINVVIDAAHGGKDHGASHDLFTEKQITDAIASKIKAINSDKDIVLHFTREGDNFVELDNRVAAINAVKPDLVLSLHVNYTTDASISGMEFFVSKESTQASKATAYADRLANKFEDKGYNVSDLKSAPFFILKKSDVPVVMVELGYLSNEIDRAYLTNDQTQDQIAGIMANFLKEIK